MNEENSKEKSLKYALYVGAILIVGLATLCFYQSRQLADYKADEAGYEEYRKNREADAIKLKQLTEDNEKMLRDMQEISNLEKKLRRALIRDVDNNKIGDLSSTSSVSPSSYTAGQGGDKILNKATTIGMLSVQNKNIKSQIDATKVSVADLLSVMEGRSGAMASFPDKWPVNGGVVSSPYGGRTDPIASGFEYHRGIDIALEYGEPIYAAGAGKVIQAGVNGGYGIFAGIDHGNGYQTRYGHMSAVVVKSGQKVAKGELIGFVGNTGYSTGPHLHFEILSDGQTIDPFFITKKQ